MTLQPNDNKNNLKNLNFPQSLEDKVERIKI